MENELLQKQSQADVLPKDIASEIASADFNALVKLFYLIRRNINPEMLDNISRSYAIDTITSEVIDEAVDEKVDENKLILEKILNRAYAIVPTLSKDLTLDVIIFISDLAHYMYDDNYILRNAVANYVIDNIVPSVINIDDVCLAYDPSKLYDFISLFMYSDDKQRKSFSEIILKHDFHTKLSLQTLSYLSWMISYVDNYGIAKHIINEVYIDIMLEKSYQMNRLNWSEKIYFFYLSYLLKSDDVYKNVINNIITSIKKHGNISSILLKFTDDQLERLMIIISRTNDINESAKYLIKNMATAIKNLNLTSATIQKLNNFALSLCCVNDDERKIISQKIMKKINISILNNIVKTGKDNVTYLALILRYVKAEDELKRIEIAKILLTNYINIMSKKNKNDINYVNIMALIDILMNVAIEYDMIDRIDDFLFSRCKDFYELSNVYFYDIIRIVNKINDKYPLKHLRVKKMIINAITYDNSGLIENLNDYEYEVIVNFIDKHYRSLRHYGSGDRYTTFKNILKYVTLNYMLRGINQEKDNDVLRRLRIFATALYHISTLNIKVYIVDRVINDMIRFDIDKLSIEELDNLSKVFKNVNHDKQTLETVVDKIISIGLSAGLSNGWRAFLRTIICYANTDSDVLKKYNNETEKHKMIKKKVKKHDAGDYGDEIQEVIGDVGKQKGDVTKKRNWQASKGANNDSDIYDNVQKKLHNNEEPQPPKTIFQDTIIKNEITQPNVTLNDEKR